ncbi:MAG: hypothetical protein CL912_24480 [Deltaproteobacteria bacterium]|nr:hypothetical protein [Deltaproteobacteria bacterium]
MVKAAHQGGLQVIGHATSQALYAQAARTGIDIITHAPVDKALDTTILNAIIMNKTKVVPTLLMMQVRVHGSPLPSTLTKTPVNNQQHRRTLLSLHVKSSR